MKKLVVGISYATEQEKEVDDFVLELKQLKIKYFYDKEHPHLFWGEYEPEILAEIYNSVDCVVAFVSQQYLNKTLPRFEMKIAFTKYIEAQDKSYYFLPIVYKDVKMPNYYHGNFHIWRDKYSLAQIAKIVDDKLKEIQKNNDKVTSFKTLIRRTLKDSKNLSVVCSNGSKDFNIILTTDKKSILFMFKYKLDSEEYFVYDYLQHLKAIIVPEKSSLKIVNYGFLSSIATEYTYDKFAEQLKGMLNETI